MRESKMLEHLNMMGYETRFGVRVVTVVLNLSDRKYQVAVPHERFQEPYCIEWVVDKMNDMIRNDIFIRKGGVK